MRFRCVIRCAWPRRTLIGLAGLALLLLLIIRFKMQAFYALILVSIVVGLAAVG